MKYVFTTEDGIRISEGDKFWYVTEQGKMFPDVCDSYTGGKVVAHAELGDKYFGVKENAEYYQKTGKGLRVSWE